MPSSPSLLSPLSTHWPHLAVHYKTRELCKYSSFATDLSWRGEAWELGYELSSRATRPLPEKRKVRGGSGHETSLVPRPFLYATQRVWRIQSMKRSEDDTIFTHTAIANDMCSCFMHKAIFLCRYRIVLQSSIVLLQSFLFHFHPLQKTSSSALLQSQISQYQEN